MLTGAPEEREEEEEEKEFRKEEEEEEEKEEFRKRRRKKWRKRRRREVIKMCMICKLYEVTRSLAHSLSLLLSLPLPHIKRPWGLSQ